MWGAAHGGCVGGCVGSHGACVGSHGGRVGVPWRQCGGLMEGHMEPVWVTLRPCGVTWSLCGVT